ncbi:MAG: sulfate transporter CysZ [Pseudomonadales bacterium]
MTGIDCVFEGLRLIRQPGLRRYVIVPVLINVAIVTAILVYAFFMFDAWIDAIVAQLPDWASFLTWLIWPIAVLAAIIFLMYGFTLVANLIASPFNAVLSTRVEQQLVGSLDDIPEIVWWKVIPRAMGRELAKIFYFLPRLLGLLILTLIPVVNILAPILLLLFSAWMMAVEYTDYAADNNEVGFRDLRRRLAGTRVQSLLFGIFVYVLMAIPVLNLVLMPAAVAGGTVYWAKNLRA